MAWVLSFDSVNSKQELFIGLDYLRHSFGLRSWYLVRNQNSKGNGTLLLAIYWLQRERVLLLAGASQAVLLEYNSSTGGLLSSTTTSSTSILLLVGITTTTSYYSTRLLATRVATSSSTTTSYHYQLLEQTTTSEQRVVVGTWQQGQKNNDVFTSRSFVHEHERVGLLVANHCVPKLIRPQQKQQTRLDYCTRLEQTTSSRLNKSWNIHYYCKTRLSRQAFFII